MEWKSKKSAGFSNAVAPDMKLDQSSPRRSQVVSLIKRNRTLLWMTTSIPQVFNISKSCSNITRSVLTEADTTIFNKELWKKNMKKFYEAVKQVFDVLMKEEILTKWLRQSSYIILFQTKWHPALNQTACCTFWGMGATITSNFVKSVSQKKKRSMVTL